MRYIVLLLVLLCGCHGGDRLQTVTKCGMSCYTLGGKLGQGACSSGVWRCDDIEDESTAVCEDQRGPETEVCDGIDNDCDGTVDEYLVRACDNLCGTGTEVCVAGAFQGCTAPVAKPEVCNGKDDDCDGFMDEPEDLPIEYCYTGPAGSLMFGECRPGVSRCEYGRKICYGQIVPRPEACDRLDNDCDGQIDEGTNSTDPVDIVFIVDNSGSMTNTINAVKLAVGNFASNYSARTEIRWALVGATAPSPAPDEHVVLQKNLTTPGQFSAAIQTQTATGGGGEPTLDAIYDLTVPMNPLGVTWTPGSRHVLILFTDELPQSYRTPEVTEVDTTASLIASGTDLFIFTTSDQTANWQAVGPPAHVSLQALTSLPSVMENALTTIIQETTCR